MSILRTKRGKLHDDLTNLLKKKDLNIDEIINIIDNYEQKNLTIIGKLKRDKLIESKRISGAIKQTISAHGPITPQYIGSATKRIMGALLTNETKHDGYVKINKKLINWFLIIAMTLGVLLIYNI